MKPLVIYHDHCTDGFGAAYAAWLKLGDKADYVGMSYGEPLDPSKIQYEDREVYILDFSFPKETMERLMAAASHVTWLDHHKSAFETWLGRYVDGMMFVDEDKRHTIILDDERSGALIAWEHFHTSEAPYIIQMIDDRDRWQFKIKDSKAFHAGMATTKPWSFVGWDMVDVNHVISIGEVLLARIEQEVKGATKKARKCEVTRIAREDDPLPMAPWSFDGHIWFAEGLAVNCGANMSEVGHELANQSGTYGLVYYIDSDNKVKVSFRSNGEYDASALAKHFGGGGHRNAAGCEISMYQLMEILK